MKSDRKEKQHHIPIRFVDAEGESGSPGSESNMDRVDPDDQPDTFLSEGDDDLTIEYPDAADVSEAEEPVGGPATAELIATRAELKRVEAENAELKDKLARRQADFENYRKRVDRERSDTYNRVVADIAAKLLPVSDNLKRALEAEASVEAAESDEFRHFLSGVDLIWKQLNGVLEALGVKQIAAVGEPFDPHVHEAVVTEATDEYEPALVKVATRK